MQVRTSESTHTRHPDIVPDVASFMLSPFAYHSPEKTAAPAPFNAPLKERNIIIPTYAQMKDPSKIPAKVKDELKGIGLWDIHPRNLFPHQLAQPTHRFRRDLRRSQFSRTSLFADGSQGAHHRHRWQVVPHGGAQSRGGV
jgi:hypothetical protein